jgi:hypothetical protein
LVQGNDLWQAENILVVTIIPTQARFEKRQAMRYVSIDIETTGLDPDTHQILEVSAIIDDLEHPEVPIEELPTINLLTPDPRQEYIVGPYTALMHKELWHFLDAIDIEALLKQTNDFPKFPFTTYQADRDYEVCFPAYIGIVLREWLDAYGYPETIIAAGKNFAEFDKVFLQADIGDDLKFAHRYLDPGTLYVLPTDEKPPSLQDCLDRAGIKQTVQHRAMDDARAVCCVLRHKLS